MDMLRERLAAALAPHYSVQGEIGSGGMGRVFRARDVRLNRDVAVKVLRPELATSRGMMRFEREAHALGRLNHPNILTVHHAGSADGLLYLVMDLADGESLESQLALQPLGRGAVLQLAHSLLDGLAAAHRRGVVHRDIKPSNIFRTAGRFVVGDFGIARFLAESGSAEAITADGMVPGTRSYMSPEQLAGGEATPESDQYAAAMVLYEAATGRSWPAVGDPRTADWAGVPGPLVPVLRRALALAPERRWPSLTAMRAALDAGVHPRLRWWIAAAAGIAAVAFVVLLGGGSPAALPEEGQSDLALLPFSSRDRTGHDVAQFAAAELEWAPWWRFRPFADVVAWWDSAGPGAEGIAPRRIGARWWVEGAIVRGAERDTARIIIHDSTRAANGYASIPGDAGHLLDWARDIADTVVRHVYPSHASEFRELSRSTRGNFAARRALLEGLAAFAADDWDGAGRHLAAALASDSSLGRAAWELWLLSEWRRAPRGGDTPLRHVVVPPPYGSLLAARNEPNLRRRDALLRKLVDSFPNNGRAKLLLFDEQFHRGPLIGLGLRDILDSMRQAMTVDAYLNQATIYDHLAWGYIHLGDRKQAGIALSRRSALRSLHDAGADTVGSLLHLGYVVRFGGIRGFVASRIAERRYLDSPEAIAPFLRIGTSLDVPALQRRLAMAVERAAGHAERGAGLVAHAVAAMELGRPREGLAALDSAAALSQDPELELQALEWRLLTPRLGLGQGEVVKDAATRQQLRQLMARDSRSRLRGHWTFAVLAALRGDPAAALQESDSLLGHDGTDPAPGYLRAIIQALVLGRKFPDSALAATDTLFVVDQAGAFGDPFARSVLHLARARWQRQLHQLAAADSSLRWYENSDLRGWTVGPPQSGDVDQMLSVPARDLRAAVLRERGQRADACALVHRASQLWSDVEPELADAAAALQAEARACR